MQLAYIIGDSMNKINTSELNIELIILLGMQIN